MNSEVKVNNIDLDQMRLYTLKEVEGVLHMTRQTLYKMIKRGELKAVKIGGRWKVSKGELERLIERGC